jgi:hypothetical protein
MVRQYSEMQHAHKQVSNDPKRVASADGVARSKLSPFSSTPFAGSPVTARNRLAAPGHQEMARHAWLQKSA